MEYPDPYNYIQKDKWLNIHSHKRLYENEVVVVSCTPGEAVAVADTGNVPVSAGVHPWHIRNNSADDEQLDLLSEAVRKPAVIAVGEAGLDNAVDLPLDIQEKIFVAQALIAARAGKPVIIHCVRAYPDIIRLRKRFSDAPPWIVHGFGGNRQEVQQLLRHDIYISLGAAFTEGSKKILEAVREIPPGRVFFETDEADTGVEDVYSSYSRFRGIDRESMRERVWNNYKNVFRAGEAGPDQSRADKAV
ncbi:MAG: hypothetical protein EA408_11060 [Marinilabiliales bacterium]|nr:MAG: hypothetical protein EA408_11060 [Marinilabiliales bacterium]